MKAQAPQAALGPSRGIVYKLAALFSIDAFAGGFAVQSLIALWLFERFDLSLTAASLFFFWSNVLAAFSYPVAARLAQALRPREHHGVHAHPVEPLPDRGGVLPNLTIVLALLLVRAALSQMDVPTRTSYVMAVVTPAGAARRRQRHGGAAQPRVRDQPGDRRGAARNDGDRRAAGDLRRAQDRLRRGAALFVPPHQAARGARLGRHRPYDTGQFSMH